jgi:hypothetical protein
VGDYPIGAFLVNLVDGNPKTMGVAEKEHEANWKIKTRQIVNNYII